MSRSSYSDDFGEDFPGQLELYRANVERSMRGKAGQARLRELREALLALSVQELHDGIFAAGTADKPAVCALGAWALHQAGGDPAKAAPFAGPSPDEDEATADALGAHGWPRLVVLDTIFQNDHDYYVYETFEGPPTRWQTYDWPMRRGRPETPAERYTRVLAWVESQIVEPPAERRTQRRA